MIDYIIVFLKRLCRKNPGIHFYQLSTLRNNQQFYFFYIFIFCLRYDLVSFPMPGTFCFINPKRQNLNGALRYYLNLRGMGAICILCAIKLNRFIFYMRVFSSIPLVFFILKILELSVFMFSFSVFFALFCFFLFFFFDNLGVGV